VSLAELFAARRAPASFETLPMSVQLDGARATLTLTLPMPFSSHAVIALKKKSGADPSVVHVRADGVATLPRDDWGYLRASPHRTENPGPGEHHDVIDLSGRGKYVGTVMHLTGRANPMSRVKDPFNFLEGDDQAQADGKSATAGTGTEEYFDAGWYFRDGPFAAPFSAAVSVGPGVADGTGEVSAVRWQALGDAVDFRDTFALTFEYGANAPATALTYESVALYYAP
jgi:hypothetical protein